MPRYHITAMTSSTPCGEYDGATLDEYTLVARDANGCTLTEEHGTYADSDEGMQAMTADARTLLARYNAARVVVWQTVSGEKHGKMVTVT